MTKILVKNGKIVNAHHTQIADVLVSNGKIEKIGENLPEEGVDTIIDATDKMVMPGGIDTHTHLEMPFMGTVSVDDYYYGTKAAIAGGTTMVCDFIIPNKGQSLHDAYRVWREKSKGKALCDYTLHMALREWNDRIKKEIPEVIEQYGINSFKMFMAYNGVLRMYDNEILEACQIIRKYGGIAMMHAENGDVIDVEAKRLVCECAISGPEGHTLSRQADVEGEATQRAIMLGHRVNCPMYIVHVMSVEAADAVINAKKAGMVCFGEPIAASLGVDGKHYCHSCWRHAAAYVMSPPLRMDTNTKDYLMEMLNIGMLDLTGTDNCTFNANQKALGKDDFRKIPNGVNGIEDRMSVIWERGVHNGVMSPERFVEVTSTKAARIFNFYPRKGAVMEGSDADIIIWDPKATRTISKDTHHHAVDFNIFEGMECHGVTTHTIAGGELAWTAEKDEFLVERGRGKFIERKPWAQFVYDKIFAKKESYNYAKYKVDRPPYDGPVIEIGK